MAVRKRGNIYQVTYRCPGESSPRTESFKSEEEATIRDKQIKLAKKNGSFVPPIRKEKGVIVETRDITVKEFLAEYVEIYGLKKWGNSYYSMCMGLIKNYINPYLGTRYVRSITVRDIDAYYTMLLDKPAVVTSGHLDTGARVTADTVTRIHKLLKSAFSKALVWEYTSINPTIGATLPERHSKERAVWSDDEALQALAACEHPILRICLYLALGCSMRLGEILGLQWHNVHFEPDYIASGEAHIKVAQELKRCSNESIDVLERVNRSTVILKFPHIMPKKATTTLVLKAPKTDSSNRVIYLPLAVVDELRKVQAQQQEHKRLLGDEYSDYNLVVAQMNGHPYEQKTIAQMFRKLIEKNGFRPVVFHSLRHSSTSLKLKLSRGNIKAVQGDTGHAEARMVTDTYAHGFDADRKLIAQEMDSSFFSKIENGTPKSDSDSDMLDLLRQMIREHPDWLPKLFAEEASR